MMAACAYGFVHGLVRVPYMKNEEKKVTAVVTSTVFGATLFPIYMFNDAKRVYMYVKKSDDQETNFDGVFDVLFS
jgi:hypothetical protein